MFEVTYQEVNKRDEVVTKRKSFKTAAVVLEDYEETKKELADWVNASPEELADVIAGM